MTNTILNKHQKKVPIFWPLLIIIFIFNYSSLFAQDDLLLLLKSETPQTNEKVIATFKGNKIINIETNETVRKSSLDLRIGHLFGNMGTESGGGIHNLYGIDQSADIRIGFHYGISDKLTIGVAHIKRNENFEGLIKYRLLEQTTNGSVPLAITFFGNTTYSIRAYDLYAKNVHRITYCSQLIFTRKFNSKFSAAIIPTYLHRNFVEAGDENNTFSISGGFRLKFSRSASIITDYSHTFGRNDVAAKTYDAIGFGVEIETGGHVFSVMFTNASGILPNDYLLYTTDSWAKGGFKFSFNISRMFPFGADNVPVSK